MAAKQVMHNINSVDSDGVFENESAAQENANIQKLSLLSLLDSHPHDGKNKSKIPDWLTDCESPFLWDSQAEKGLGSEQVIHRALEKLDELDIESLEFSLERYIQFLKLVLEYYLTGNQEKSWETMKTIEDLLEKDVCGNDDYYHKVKLSLGHVVSATEAYLLAADGQEEKSQKIAQNIIPLQIMSDSDLAGLYSMKARFFLYSGYEKGEDIGVEFARKALELEPSNARWQFLLAKVLRQQRKEIPFSMDIPREELTLLESAVEKERQPKYLVYLAQIYRECSFQAYKQYKSTPGFYKSELFHTIQKMPVKALNYYKEALELKPDSPSNLRRIGHGIMNLPKDVADYDLALKCLLKSLELHENFIVLHVLGTFYHRYGHDNNKALEYFEKTAKGGSHAGLCDMIRVKYLLNSEYDPTADLQYGLTWEVKRKQRTFLIAQLAGYHLLIKRDIKKSIEYFNQIIADDKDCICMKKFKSFFLRMDEPIDLYEYLTNEAMLLLQEKATKDDSGSDEDELNQLGCVEDLLDKISEIRPELMEITPDPSLINRLHQVSKEIIDRDKAKSSRQRNDGRSFPNNPRYNRSNEQNRGGRGRGGSYSNKENHCGSKENSYRGRETSEENCERRGRFSIANQRDRDSSRRNCSDREWNRRNRQSDGHHDTSASSYQNQRSEENKNWRKK